MMRILKNMGFIGKRRFTLWGLALCLVSVFAGLWFQVERVAIFPPGPFVIMLVLGIIALLVGLSLDSLRAEREPPPIIIGLDTLMDHWKKYWLASDEDKRKGDREIMYEQVRIIQQLFRGSKEVKLLKAFDGNKAEKGVFLIKKDNDPERVLKFDTLDNMRKERDSFKTYTSPLSPYTPGREVAHWPREADWGLGDKRGAFVHERAQLGAGSDLQTFGQYYKDLTPDVGNALDEIIKVLDTWWGDQKPKSKPSFEEYKRLTEKAQKMEDGWKKTLSEYPELSGLPMDAANAQFSFSRKSLPNPLHWVRSEFRAICDRLDKLSRWDSIVHGDFHSGNILVEHKGGSIVIWLIDFPHTHIGPAVQDMARLEADIKFGLLPSNLLQNLNTDGIYSFEESLFSDNPNLATLPLNSGPRDPELARAWGAISKLRNKAQAYIAGNRAHYDLALLHATLPTLYYQDRQPWQKVYAFISAALLCHRLSLQLPKLPRGK